MKRDKRHVIEAQRDAVELAAIEAEAQRRENDSQIVGVCIRNCRDRATGVIAPWAQAYIDHVNSYTEVDSAGTGIQMFCRATMPDGVTRSLSMDGRVEMRQLNPDECYEVTRMLELRGRRAQ